MTHHIHLLKSICGESLFHLVLGSILQHPLLAGQILVDSWDPVHLTNPRFEVALDVFYRDGV